MIEKSGGIVADNWTTLIFHAKVQVSTDEMEDNDDNDDFFV